MSTFSVSHCLHRRFFFTSLTFSLFLSLRHALPSPLSLIFLKCLGNFSRMPKRPLWKEWFVYFAYYFEPAEINDSISDMFLMEFSNHFKSNWDSLSISFFILKVTLYTFATENGRNMFFDNFDVWHLSTFSKDSYNYKTEQVSLCEHDRL